VDWVEVLAVFAVCHLVGDFILQTNWQARHKHGGLRSDPLARRALAWHITTYALAFVPAWLWIAGERGWLAVLIAVAVIVPHTIQDDGRTLRAYMIAVKRADPDDDRLLAVFVDQAFHGVALFGAACLIAL
jgi:fatty acid desaturase